MDPCAGQVNVRMFGGDHRPNPKDLGEMNRDDVFYEDADDEAYYEEGDDEYYENYDDDDDGFESYEEAFYEDEVPEDLENAADLVEDAYVVSYVESQRLMRELALSRGFYPIIALGPEAQNDKGKGFSRGGKGKGKSKGGKGKGKSKGGGGFKKTPRSRRPASGLRRPPPSSTASGSSSTNTGFKSILSGSTSQHGLRFK